MATRVAPLVVIVGETASGKSDLAMYLAERFDGEIIAADSRTVYKGMDIGTAKPSSDDRARVKHHLLDVTTPDQKYNAARFQKDAKAAITDIYSRGKLPIMAGGTGLYIDSVIYSYNFDNKTMQELRSDTLVIGVRREKDDLTQRITLRIEKMIEEGFIEEVKGLGKKYGWDAPAMTGIGYRAFAEYIHGRITLHEAKERFIKGDKDLAKRQRTWFKRNKSIHWVEKQSEAVELVTTLLRKS